MIRVDARAGAGCQRVWLGASSSCVGGTLRFGEGVVFKADYRHYNENPYPDADHFNLGNSLNLGIGFSF